MNSVKKDITSLKNSITTYGLYDKLFGFDTYTLIKFFDSSYSDLYVNPPILTLLSLISELKSF